MNRISAGMCGIFDTLFGKKKKNDDSSGVTMDPAGNLQGNKFRSSFRIPQDKAKGDEFVVDDACGNPLFVKLEDEGKPVVRDLGGNVLEVEVGDDHMVAVYNCAPPSTNRLNPPSSTTTTTTTTTTPAAAVEASAIMSASEPVDSNPAAAVSKAEVIQENTSSQALQPYSAVSQPELITTTSPQPEPVAVVTQPEPAAIIAQPEPTAVAAQPESTAAVTQPEPTAVVAQSEPAQPETTQPEPEPAPVQAVDPESIEAEKKQKEAEDAKAIISGLDNILSDINAMWA